MPGYVWLLVSIGVVGIPAATAVLLYRGGVAVGLGRARAARVAGVAGAVWAAWIVGSGLLAAAGAYRQDPEVVRPWIGVALLGAFLAALAATRIPVVARILEAPGTAARLAAPQAFRVVGVVFLVALALGALPPVFALPAGLGDIAVGIAALAVARGAARGRAVRFHLLGALDLVVAVSIGVLAGLGPSRVLVTDPSTEAIGLLPLVLVPTTAVPLALALHVVALAKLRSPAPAR
jgi:hypothetical protein